MSAQRHFAEAVLAAEPLCPPGLMAWNGSDPARRFAVYRNNVMVSLIDALADSYPVTQDLVGEEFFRAMARLFVRTQPPRSPVLALYGAGLAEFIEGFAPAAALPYLADVARLEMLRVQAWHAADAVPLGLADFAALLENAPALAATGFDLHPSLAVLRSAHAVVSLWAAHQAQDGMPDLAAVDPRCPNRPSSCAPGSTSKFGGFRAPRHNSSCTYSRVWPSAPQPNLPWTSSPPSICQPCSAC